jgi:hypothetical protein
MRITSFCLLLVMESTTVHAAARAHAPLPHGSFAVRNADTAVRTRTTPTPTDDHSSASPPARSAGPIALALLGGGAIVAGVIVGVAGFLPAMSALQSACPGSDCARTPTNEQLYANAQSFGWGANLLVGFGVFAAGTGLVWWLVERSDAARAPVHVSWTIGLGAVGIAAGGRF